MNSVLDTESKWCLHFYTYKVTYEQFRDIEHNVLNAEHYGIEVSCEEEA